MIAGQGTLRPIEIIEDLVPLRDVTVKLRVSRHIRSAKRMPGGITLRVGGRDGVRNRGGQ